MPSTLRSDSELVAPIRCIFSDVDGVMTNGEITYSSSGEETKTFHVRDGLAVKLWMRSGYPFCIITARESSVVQRRAQELGIESVHQGRSDKLAVATDVLAKHDLDWSSVCYIGDDLPDLPVMLRSGLAVTPADGAKDVCEASDWILKSEGGKGAIRECVERILRAKGLWEACV